MPQALWLIDLLLKALPVPPSICLPHRVARCMAAPQLRVTIPPELAAAGGASSPEARVAASLAAGQRTLPRASMVVHGGDLCYPSPTGGQWHCPGGHVGLSTCCLCPANQPADAAGTIPCVDVCSAPALLPQARAPWPTLPTHTDEVFETRLFGPYQEAFPPPRHVHPGHLVVNKPDLRPEHWVAAGVAECRCGGASGATACGTHGGRRGDAERPCRWEAGGRLQGELSSACCC